MTLENLVLKGGTAPNGPGIFADGEPGGAIYNAGTLILEHCVITSNTSGGGQYVEGNIGGTGGGDGGGIYNAGTLWASECDIVGNSSGAGVDGAFGGNGGGLRNDGFCFLTNCIISGNQSGGGGGPAGNLVGFGGSAGNGGGIFNAGTMVLGGCSIGANAAGPGAGGGEPSGLLEPGVPGGWGGNGGSGGGIYNVGQMEINFSSVYDNSTGNGGGGGRGIGLDAEGGSAGVGGNGAGIFNAGELSLNTSTISGNLCGNGGTGGNAFGLAGAVGGAGGSGGGIYNDGSLDLTSCTIALNQTGVGGNGGNSVNGSSAASGGQGGDGGGILNDASNTNAVLRNTLIAQNLVNIGGAGGTNNVTTVSYGQPPTTQTQIGDSGADGAGFDVAGDFTSQRFNLIGMSDASTGFRNGVNADQVGSDASPIDPLLGPLQMNGGLTPTHALLWGSPAIDQGNCFGIHRDQRGHYRPHVFSTIPFAPGGDGSDIGAFELDSAGGS